MTLYTGPFYFGVEFHFIFFLFHAESVVITFFYGYPAKKKQSCTQTCNLSTFLLPIFIQCHVVLRKIDSFGYIMYLLELQPTIMKMKFIHLIFNTFTFFYLNPTA